MENKAHYALIGIFVSFCVLLLSLFVVWFANVRFDTGLDRYEVHFYGPVRGISVGSEVHYIGLRVGEVVDLSFNPEVADSVIATIEIREDTPVYLGSFARLEPLGLTGLNYIQVFSGNEKKQLLKQISDPPYDIPGQMSQIDLLVEGSSSIMVGTQQLINRVNATFTPEMIANLQGIVRHINSFSETLAAINLESDLLSETLESVKIAAHNISESAIAVQKAAGEVEGVFGQEGYDTLVAAQTALAEADKSLIALTALAGHSSELVIDSRDAINRLSNAGFRDIEITIADFRRLVESLNKITDDIEKNPIRFLSGEQRVEVTLPE